MFSKEIILKKKKRYVNIVKNKFLEE